MSLRGERHVTIIHGKRTPQSRADRSKDVVDRWGRGGWGDKCSLTAGYRFSLPLEVWQLSRVFSPPAGSDFVLSIQDYFLKHILINKSVHKSED